MKEKYIILVVSILFMACKKQANNNTYETIIEELVNSYSDQDITKEMELHSVNCLLTPRILTELYERDQEIRNDGDGNMEEIDRQNLKYFVSLVEACGFPTKDDFVGRKSSDAVFLILQHAPKEWMAYYYFDLKKLVDSGVLGKDDLAYFQDRFLSYHDYPQIYGSQIVDGHLYPVHDLEKINQKRKEVGLGKIESYLEHFGLDLKTEMEYSKKNPTINQFN